MNMKYEMEDHIEWVSADKINLKIKGWKELKIEYIESNSFLLWRMNGVPGYYRSDINTVINEGGVTFHVARVLDSMKSSVLSNISSMEEKDREFYSKFYFPLFE